MAKTPETLAKTDAKGPSMSRSQAQIAMSYAPGQHFTFEGAAGLARRCRRPMRRRLGWPKPRRRKLRCASTRQRALGLTRPITCRESDNTAPRPFPDFCVDVSLLDTSRTQYAFRPQAFAYLKPDRMGYLPRPTTLICSECGLIEATENPKQMGQRLSELSQACPHPKRPDDSGQLFVGSARCDFRALVGFVEICQPKHDGL